MPKFKTAPILASLGLHLLVVFAMTPGHHEEHTVHLFKGLIELGESGDGHASRPHLHSRKNKPVPTQDQELPRPSPLERASRPTVDISTPTFEGNAGSARTLSEGDLYLLEVIKKIRSLQTYPRESLIQEEEGVVRIALTIAEDGNIAHSEVSQPSPYEALNQSALHSVRSAGPFSALPKIWNHSIRVQIPIHYELSGR